MSQIKCNNTKAELAFRKYIWSKNLRGYRIKNKLPGRPDIYFPKKKIAVFIDGCFWHKCPRCFIPPKSEKKYWNQKIKKNVQRDKKTTKTLKKKNISVLRFWEHEIKKNPDICYRKLKKVYEKNKSKKKYRTLDLFAGIGGIRIGFEKAGFKTVYANDFDKYCKPTYDTNFKNTKLIIKDIRKIKIKKLPRFDFILAGFPCQAFSVAGYREGFKDRKKRGELFFEIARILDEVKPMGIFLENVKNLKGHNKGRTFKIISKTLRDLGYYIKTDVLNSKDYGNIPQNRERIYIVGFKSKDYLDKFSFPKPKKLTVKVTDLLDKKVDKKYYYNGKPLFDRVKNDINEIGKVYQWRRKYVRENKNGVCPTLTANMGMGGHNVPIIKDKKGIRKLTPRECARLQGFPDSFILPNELADSRLYKQIGNSVSTPVIKAIATQIMKVLENKVTEYQTTLTL